MSKENWYYTRPFSEEPLDFLNVTSGEYDKKRVGVENWVENTAIVAGIRYVILKHMPKGATTETYACGFYCPEYGPEHSIPDDLQEILEEELSPQDWKEEFTLGTKFKISTLRRNGHVYVDVYWGEDPGGPSVIPLYFRLLVN